MEYISECSLYSHLFPDILIFISCRNWSQNQSLRKGEKIILLFIVFWNKTENLQPHGSGSEVQVGHSSESTIFCRKMSKFQPRQKSEFHLFVIQLASSCYL
jgi:hypothetical protein